MTLREQNKLMGEKITAAMDIITEYGWIDGDHHKQWCLDQIARALLGDNYETWLKHICSDCDEWDEGIAP